MRQTKSELGHFAMPLHIQRSLSPAALQPHISTKMLERPRQPCSVACNICTSGLVGHPSGEACGAPPLHLRYMFSIGKCRGCKPRPLRISYARTNIIFTQSRSCKGAKSGDHLRASSMLCAKARPHLYCKVGANALDGVAHVHMLVNGQDVRPAGRHALQKPPAATDVQNDLQLRMRLQQDTPLSL